MKLFDIAVSKHTTRYSHIRINTEITKYILKHTTRYYCYHITRYY